MSTRRSFPSASLALLAFLPTLASAGGVTPFAPSTLPDDGGKADPLARCERKDFVAPVSFRLLEGTWSGRTSVLKDPSASEVQVIVDFTQTYRIEGADYLAKARAVVGGSPFESTMKGHFACDGKLVLTEGLPQGWTAHGTATPSRVVYQGTGPQGERIIESLSITDEGLLTSTKQDVKGGAVVQLEFGAAKRTSAAPDLRVEPLAGGAKPPYALPRCERADFRAPELLRAYTGRWEGDITTVDARTGKVLRRGRTEGDTSITGPDYKLTYTFLLDQTPPITYVNEGVLSCDGYLSFTNPALSGISWAANGNVFQQRVSLQKPSDVSFDTITFLDPENVLRTTHRTSEGELVEVLFMRESLVK